MMQYFSGKCNEQNDEPIPKSTFPLIVQVPNNSPDNDSVAVKSRLGPREFVVESRGFGNERGLLK